MPGVFWVVTALTVSLFVSLAIATQTVTALIRPEPQATYELVLRDGGGEREVFYSSADHPWFVVGRGWVETAQLQPQDRIVSALSADLTVQSLTLTGRTDTTSLPTFLARLGGKFSEGQRR